MDAYVRGSEHAIFRFHPCDKKTTPTTTELLLLDVHKGSSENRARPTRQHNQINAHAAGRRVYACGHGVDVLVCAVARRSVLCLFVYVCMICVESSRHLAELASGLDILQGVRDADLYHARDAASEDGFALVLGLEVRRRSHLALLSFSLSECRWCCGCLCSLC